MYIYICALTYHILIRQGLKNRILLAAHQRKPFSVVIVTPYHQEGRLDNPGVLAVLDWMQRSICKGEQSLVRTLERELPPGTQVTLIFHIHYT